MDKKIKACGMILFVKAIIEIIVSVIGLSGGLALAIGGIILSSKNSNTGDAFSNQVANCTSTFVGTIGIFFGIITIILSIIIGIFALIYFINSRKLLYIRPIPKKSYITLKVLEIVFIIFSIVGIVICIFNLKDTYIFMIVLSVILLQSFITTTELSKIEMNNQAVQ